MEQSTYDEIFKSLKILLAVTEDDEPILREILNDAISEIKEARKYPSDMTASAIEEDMQNYISNVKKLTKYDYGQIGGEFQESHNENGVSRSYMDRRKCFDGVLPYCTQF